MSIPADIRVVRYKTIRAIAVDYCTPQAFERTCTVYYGPTGTGKSRRAWEEAGISAYPKDPRTKFWDGYQNHEHVVIDEFRGAIDISHMLRWTDCYPVLVEIKGSSVVFKARKIWITSNLAPEQWYPGLDSDTLAALRRRLKVTRFSDFFQ